MNIEDDNNGKGGPPAEFHSKAIEEAAKAADVSTSIRLRLTDAVLENAAGQSSKALLIFEGLLNEFGTRIETGELRFFYEEIQQRRGLVLVQLGRYMEAVRILEDCVGSDFDLTDKDRALLLFNLAFSLRKTGNQISSKRVLKSILELEPSPSIAPAARYQLGILEYETGNFVEATELFRLCQTSAGGDLPLSMENVDQWLKAAEEKIITR
jgi:tetratricopeptide (TPR) repeat protein